MKTVVFALSLGILSVLYGTSLKIIDTDSVSTVVSSPIIYYTSKYGSGLDIFYSSDTESTGIRFSKGKGVVFIRWDAINQIDFLDNTQHRVKITLKN